MIRGGLSEMLGTVHGVQTLRLLNGGVMSFREYGKPDGFPVVFSHGNTNSRMFEACWERTQEATLAAQVRLIAVDRPGIGLSTFVPSRTYSDYGDSIIQLADALQLKRFAVLGFSSGGPHTLAIAATDPARVSACGLCSSDAPYWLMERDHPGIIQRMYGFPATEILASPVAVTKQRAATALQQMKETYEAIPSVAKREIALADLKEASSQGVEGVASDSQLEVNPWGFELSRLATVPTLIWHGTDDKDVPLLAGEYLASKLPHARTQWVEGENHSMIRRHWQRILSELLAASAPSTKETSAL